MYEPVVLVLGAFLHVTAFIYVDERLDRRPRVRGTLPPGPRSHIRVSAGLTTLPSMSVALYIVGMQVEPRRVKHSWYGSHLS